jgi:hypothetical protein
MDDFVDHPMSVKQGFQPLAGAAKQAWVSLSLSSVPP